MADIPQEVRGGKARVYAMLNLPFSLPAKYVEMIEKYGADMFLAGKRAGMERAAEIAYRTCAETRHVSLGDKCAQAIRSENDGHS